MSNTIQTTYPVSFYTLTSVQNMLDSTMSSDIEMTSINDELVHLMSIGKENIQTISFKEWFHDIKVMLGRLNTRVYRLMRNLVENVSKQYVFIMKMWDTKIQKHLHDIDDEHFDQVVISCVPSDILKTRISVIRDIASMIEKIESIVEAPIDDPEDPNSYNTPIFVKLYKEISDIGFSMTNRTFTESKSQGYKSKEVKKTISELDYSKQSLPELVNVAKSIAQLATKKWMTETSTRFVKYNESLLYKEKRLLDNQAMDQYDKEQEIQKVRIRISRLWWLSNFVHLLGVLTEDQMGYILKVFRAAESSIPLATNPEDDGPGSKYF